MNYSELTDAELSLRLFMAANIGAKIENSEVIEIFDSITYTEDDEVEWFSILDFADLMPIAIENGIYYVIYRGHDYNRGKYKSVAVDADGNHDHVTFNHSVERAVAICLLKKLEPEDGQLND